MYVSPQPKLQFFDANGAPLVGGKLFTYAAGTSTPLATYTDAGGNTPTPNPVILDARGEANVWLSGSSYKFVLQTSTGVPVWTVDGLTGASGGGGGGGGSGATGGTGNYVFWENDTIIFSDYTITSLKNAGTFGPVTVNSGILVNVPAGTVWSIV